jgi:tetratricopeptide (TPR) repeat protein
MKGLSAPLACLLLVLVAAPPGPALAQAPSARNAAGEATTSADPRQSAIDALFASLSAAADEDTAKGIAAAIWRAWLESGSDSVDLLVVRAASAIEDKEYDTALDLLNAVVELEPAYAEGWNKRATVFYLLREYDKSISDISHVLALEPRHFGAMAGLGAMLKETGRDDAALAIYRRALEVNPHLPGAKRAVDELSVKVEGRDI